MQDFRADAIQLLYDLLHIMSHRKHLNIRWQFGKVRQHRVKMLKILPALMQPPQHRNLRIFQELHCLKRYQCIGNYHLEISGIAQKFLRLCDKMFLYPHKNPKLLQFLPEFPVQHRNHFQRITLPVIAANHIQQHNRRSRPG